MAGRAGRRGLDPFGSVYILCSSDQLPDQQVMELGGDFIPIIRQLESFRSGSYENAPGEGHSVAKSFQIDL